MRIIVYHDEYGKVRINSRNGAQTLNPTKGVVQRVTHAYPAAFNNDDGGFRTKERVYVHEVYTFINSEPHAAIGYKCVSMVAEQ